MNKQRKILITVIYNDLGIIVDTKAEEFDLSANLQQTCNQLATDTISRQAAVNEIAKFMLEYGGENEKRERDALHRAANGVKALPSAKTELEDKILTIGYTGKEGHIYIGGRLFAVRELAQ